MLVSKSKKDWKPQAQFWGGFLIESVRYLTKLFALKMKKKQPISVVTGAAGFLGSHLTDLLVARGHKVIGIASFDVTATSSSAYNSAISFNTNKPDALKSVGALSGSNYLQLPNGSNLLWSTFKNSAKVEVVYLTGGPVPVGSESLYEVSFGVATEQASGGDIAPQQITVEDFGETLAADRTAYKALPNPRKVKVTLQANVPWRDIDEKGTRYKPISQTVMPASDNDNLNRTKLGVGEEVILYFKPDLSKNAKWETSAGGLSQTNYTSNYFTAPSNATPNVVVKATIKGKTVSFPPFNVVEPSSATSIIESNDTYAAGSQGAGMHLIITWHPTDVSFYRVQIREVSGPASNITGYFTNTPATNLWHYANANWVLLTMENSLRDHSDFAGIAPPWFPGGFDRDIPMQWKIAGSSITNNNFPHELSQKRITATDGTTTITKLGSSTTRTP